MIARPQHIFFSPHADDVVLSCGGTIHDLVSQDKAVGVVGVFAGVSGSAHSAYARHLHAKWRLGDDAIDQRWREDSSALKSLRVKHTDRWNYCEAPYRRDDAGLPLYTTNQELVGAINAGDGPLLEQLFSRSEEYVSGTESDHVLYFPLAIGNHVDHQLLFKVGLKMIGTGHQVRFYEDFPYIESYVANGYREWQPEIFAIDVDPKAVAASEYASQLYGLGGSASVLKARLESIATAVGCGKPGERFWFIGTRDAEKILARESAECSPFVAKKVRLGLRDFGSFLHTFRWHDLAEILPPGTGPCLDVGCGSGRHRSIIEARGYQWIGTDSAGTADFRSDASYLPIRSESQAAIVAWQILEYVDDPQRVFAEAARVLEPGGVFCGSASFLEPIHGLTYFNLSPLILEKLLRNNGFGDIEIRPGLNGFALMLWTWLRRMPLPHAAEVAIPLAFMLFAPLALALFAVSWMSWRVGIGTGHLMRWISKTAPFEFAGHVIFTARKLAPHKLCTSHS